MFKIKTIKARQILDSRGQPTVEVAVQTEQGVFRASVPSGTSCGRYEAVAVSASEAVKNIEQVIAPTFVGEDFGGAAAQEKIDKILIALDGTDNKSRLGANAILAVSIACCRAGAAAKNLPLFRYIYSLIPTNTFSTIVENVLPRPCFNILEGGVHASNNLDIQEFMVVPECNGFKENLSAGVKIYHTLKQVLTKKFGSRGKSAGQEGGFAPPISKTKQALDLIMEAITGAGYLGKTKIGLDCAASEFHKEEEGVYEFEDKKITAQELLRFYQDLISKYPILFIEDPFSQDDWNSWQRISSSVILSQQAPLEALPLTGQAKNPIIVADDLTATNPKRIRKAQENQACAAVIIKPNQIGTVTEVIQAVKLAKQFGWKIIVSHRSGETGDDFIADLAVGIAADFIKSGAPGSSERMAKYNRLLEIEELIK